MHPRRWIQVEGVPACSLDPARSPAVVRVPRDRCRSPGSTVHHSQGPGSTVHHSQGRGVLLVSGPGRVRKHGRGAAGLVTTRSHGSTAVDGRGHRLCGCQRGPTAVRHPRRLRGLAGDTSLEDATARVTLARAGLLGGSESEPGLAAYTQLLETSADQRCLRDPTR